MKPCGKTGKAGKQEKRKTGNKKGEKTGKTGKVGRQEARKQRRKTRKTGKQERRVCSRGPVINGYRKSVIAKFGVQNIHEAFTMAMIHKLL